MSEISQSPQPERFDQLEQQLQQYLARPPFWLRFPPEIDQQFENQGKPIRLRRFIKVSWLSLLFFDLLAISDFFTSPANYQLAWCIRLLLVTPLSAIILLLLPRPWLANWRGSLLSCLLILAATGISLIEILSPAPSIHNEYFHLQWLLILLTGNLLFRLRFGTALPVSAVLFLIYAATTIFIARGSLPLSGNAIILMGMVTVISLIAKYRMELDNRISYALKTQQKIAHYRLERANKKLAQQAARDGLTGIYNRRMLDDSYQRLWRQAVRKHRPISVLFIDVDHFKRYNDSYGHAEGDACLCWLADILQATAQRPLDLSARFGGEEFVVVLPDTRPEEAGVVAEQIRARVLSTHRPHAGSKEGCVTVSIGVAGGIPQSSEEINFYIEQADKALYIAKSRGRNQVSYSL